MPGQIPRGERCEWNPTLHRPARDDDNPPHDAIATISLGALSAWHVCADCAKLPHFSRFRTRAPLRRARSDDEPPLMAADLRWEWPCRDH